MKRWIAVYQGHAHLYDEEPVWNKENAEWNGSILCDLTLVQAEQIVDRTLESYKDKVEIEINEAVPVEITDEILDEMLNRSWCDEWKITWERRIKKIDGEYYYGEMDCRPDEPVFVPRKALRTVKDVKSLI